MSAPKGWSTQEKDQRLQPQFATVEPVRTLQHGLSVLAHQFLMEMASETAEAGSTAISIISTGSVAKAGDVILLTSGALSGQEIKVYSVSGNVITLAEELPSAIAAGVTFDILRHKYPVVTSDGRVKVDAVLTEAAVAPDGDPLPAEIKIVGGYDGSAVHVLKTDSDGELQIDVLSSALPSGAATSAAQTDGSQKTQIVDGSGNVISSTGNALDVNLKTPITVDVSLSQANDSVAVFGSDGAVNRALKTDASGELQVDILSSALPAGAATESTLSAISAKIPALASSGGIPVEVLQQDGLLDSGNTTAVALGVSGVFTGSWTDGVNWSAFQLGVFSDQASATNGLNVQFSYDGISVHHNHYYTYAGGSNGIGYAFPLEFRYFRIVYTNNAVAQTTFRLITVLKASAIQPSQYRLTNPLSDETQASVTRSLIFGKTTGGGGGYVDVKVNPSGALTVDATVTSSALPSGAATETTLADIKTSVQLLDNAVSGNEIQVDVVAPLPAGTNTIGKVDLNTLSVVDLLDANILDTSSTNIPGSASSPVQVIASTAANIKALQLLDTTGAFVGIYTGAAASEVLKLVMGPGSDQTIQHSIPAGTRISLKRLDSTVAVSSGIVAINCLG